MWHTKLTQTNRGICEKSLHSGNFTQSIILLVNMFLTNETLLFEDFY